MSVTVLDNNGQFVEVVAPAVARFALRQGSATIVHKNPFIIKLQPSLDSCPRPASRVSATMPDPEIIRVERQLTMNNFSNPAESMFDIVDFFRKVDRANGGDGIIWAKATAPQGRQVIIEPTTAQGKRIKVPAVRPGDPVCLSKYATFEALRDSTDLLNAANGHLVKLMTHAEANAYFSRKASMLKTTPQALMARAEQDSRANAQASMKTLDTNAVDKSMRIQNEFVSVEDAVNPRLHHLCAQVQPMLKPEQRMPVNELMAEVLDLEESLTLDDLTYLQSQGYYPTVKKWAETKYAEVARASGLLPETDALSE